MAATPAGPPPRAPHPPTAPHPPRARPRGVRGSWEGKRCGEKGQTSEGRARGPRRGALPSEVLGLPEEEEAAPYWRHQMLGVVKGNVMQLTFSNFKRKRVLSCENNAEGQGGASDRKMASRGLF